MGMKWAPCMGMGMELHEIPWSSMEMGISSKRQLPTGGLPSELLWADGNKLSIPRGRVASL